jgi:oxygen-dependent protoporphyrinogen oxidase
MARIVIVGGGISGLALATRLEQRLPDVDVLVLERQSRLGGTIDTVRRDGFQIEGGPNGFLDNKPTTLTLCRDVGLDGRLIPASEASGRNRFLFLDGRLRLLPGGLWSFLRSDVLSWRAKLSLFFERWRPRRRSYDDESIDAFVRRRAGGEIARTLADAFVTGIFAGDPKLLSVQAALPRLAAMERDHGSVMRGMSRARKQRLAEAAARGETVPRTTGRMWSFREGLSLLVDTLRERLRQRPILGVVTHSLHRLPNGRWRIQAEGRDAWDADAVALTCPADQQAALLVEEDATLAQLIDAIPYNRVVVVALGFRAADVRHRLDGFGYLSPQRRRRDVLGVQWCSSIFSNRAPPGMVLLRAICGGWNRGEVVDWDDARLLDAVRGELAQSMDVHVAPVFHHIVRWPRAIPQYLVGHLDRVAAIDERAGHHPGLFLGGNAYRGVAMNDCVEQADLMAGRISEYVRDGNQGPIPRLFRPASA